MASSIVSIFFFFFFFFFSPLPLRSLLLHSKIVKRKAIKTRRKKNKRNNGHYTSTFHQNRILDCCSRVFVRCTFVPYLFWFWVRAQRYDRAVHATCAVIFLRLHLRCTSDLPYRAVWASKCSQKPTINVQYSDSVHRAHNLTQNVRATRKKKEKEIRSFQLPHSSNSLTPRTSSLLRALRVVSDFLRMRNCVNNILFAASIGFAMQPMPIWTWVRSQRTDDVIRIWIYNLIYNFHWIIKLGYCIHCSTCEYALHPVGWAKMNAFGAAINCPLLLHTHATLLRCSRSRLSCDSLLSFFSLRNADVSIHHRNEFKRICGSSAQ